MPRKGEKHSEESKEKMGTRMALLWANPDNRRRFLATNHQRQISLATRAKISEAKRSPAPTCSFGDCAELAARSKDGYRWNRRCPEHGKPGATWVAPPACGWKGCENPVKIHRNGGRAKRCVGHRGLFDGWLSAPEGIMTNALEEWGVDYLQQARLPRVKHPYDFLLPDLKVAIEVDGCRWHCCPDHPEQWKDWDKRRVGRRRGRDKRVEQWALSRGWTTHRIWEHDVNDEKRLDEFLASILD